jgi:hypothetical protein
MELHPDPHLDFNKENPMKIALNNVFIQSPYINDKTKILGIFHPDDAGFMPEGHDEDDYTNHVDFEKALESSPNSEWSYVNLIIGDKVIEDALVVVFEET